MADANGIIFKNPTLNTWFVGPSVDLTAWNVITVSDFTDAAFNLDYTYVPATAKWNNGIRNIWKDTLWYMTDGTTTYTAADNGLNIPPALFSGTLPYPQTLTVIGAGISFINQEYILSTPMFGYPSYIGTTLSTRISRSINADFWVFGPGRYVVEDQAPNVIIPKIGWIGATPPYPTLEYTLEAAATISTSSSTATWVSNNPTTGFVSLTDTPDEDFGYVITFDVQSGVAYPYYKYCTKGTGEVYGTLPEATRDNFIFAGWYTTPEGQGTRIAATDELLESADATLYAKWVKNVSGKVGCGACLVSLFALGIGTDIFCEYIGSRLAKTTARTIVRKLPKP